MKKEDEELLARVAKEEAEEGLVLELNVSETPLHKTLKRLIDMPPTPKHQRTRSKKRQRKN